MSLKSAIDEISRVRSDNEWLSIVLQEALHSERTVPALKHDDWLSVSKIAYLCPRQQVIASRLGVELVDEWSAQARWRADRGTAIHHVFQEMWLGPLKLLLGGWRCPKCTKVYGADENGEVWPSTAIVCPDLCEACGQKWRRQEPFHFVEPYSIDTQLKVRGRIDGLLRLPGYYPEVIDLKTTHFIGSEGKPWSVVRNPRISDVKQLHWYMDSTQCRRGRVIYMDPAAERIEDAIVEHKVSFNPSLLHREREKVRVLREALKEEGRPVPACPYDRKLPFGDCPCTQVESLWASAGG